MPNSIITGTGSYIPTVKIPNKHFLAHDFYGADGIKLAKSNDEIIRKFQEITCIDERRYVSDELDITDIAFQCAKLSPGKQRNDLAKWIKLHNRF